MSAGPTTRAFVDKDNIPVNSIGGQNANGDYVAGQTATDINGAPIVVALDSSVQSVVAAMSTSNTALASIQSSATALVTAAGTEITLLGEIFTVAGTLATAAAQTTGNGSLATIATNTSGLATDAHLVAQTAAIGTGNTTLAAIAASVAAGATAAGQSTAAGYASTTATNTTAISGATGAIADAAYSGSGGGSIVSLLKWIGAKLSGTLAVSGTFWQATQPVSIATAPVLVAGSAIIGKVGIDQATPGTTNKVTLGSDVVNVAAANPASGTDRSQNAPGTLAILGTFNVTNPGAYRVQNQSGSVIQVIMDNGTSGPTIFLLSPGGANQQGSDTSPEIPWFTGRIQVAGPAGSQFAARSN